MVSLILSVLSYLIYRWMRAKDARRQLTAVFFLLSVWFLLAVIGEVVSYFIDDLVGYAAAAILLLAPLTVLFVAGILIANGLKMFRKEGRSVGNSLSGLLGVVLVMVPTAAVLLVAYGEVVGPAIALYLFLISAQLGVSFLVFWTYAKLYAHRDPRTGPDAVVVLGSRLIKGKVPPLLAARLDLGRKAFTTYRDPRRTIMIPSGGQGPDEARPEGEAMAEYLVEHGVDPQDVVAETRARTTEENLIFSRTLADTGEPQGPLLVVTNGYHAPRAALLSRKIKVDADVIGAKTARYFVPSAFLREFVAVMVMHKWLHGALAACSLALSVFVLGLALNWI